MRNVSVGNIVDTTYSIDFVSQTPSRCMMHAMPCDVGVNTNGIRWHDLREHHIQGRCVFTHSLSITQFYLVLRVSVGTLCNSTATSVLWVNCYITF